MHFKQFSFKESMTGKISELSIGLEVALLYQYVVPRHGSRRFRWNICKISTINRTSFADGYSTCTGIESCQWLIVNSEGNQCLRVRVGSDMVLYGSKDWKIFHCEETSTCKKQKFKCIPTFYLNMQLIY